MKEYINLGVVLIILLLVIAAVIAWKFLRDSDPDLNEDQDADDKDIEDDIEDDIEEDYASDDATLKDLFPAGRGKKSQTVLLNMPVLSYKMPGGEWINVPVRRAHTSIGRDKKCDIFIDNRTVSLKHAEIAMKIHRFKESADGKKYFILKNISKENPISFYGEEDGEWRDITSYVPLIRSQRNAFYVGEVEMRVTFPQQERHLSDDPKPFESMGADFAEDSANASSGGKNVKSGQASLKKETYKQEQGSASASSENKRERAGAASGQGNSADEQKLEEELLKAKRKVMRRSPRSGNRI